MKEFHVSVPYVYVGSVTTTPNTVREAHLFETLGLRWKETKNTLFVSKPEKYKSSNVSSLRHYLCRKAVYPDEIPSIEYNAGVVCVSSFRVLHMYVSNVLRNRVSLFVVSAKGKSSWRDGQAEKREKIPWTHFSLFSLACRSISSCLCWCNNHDSCGDNRRRQHKRHAGMRDLRKVEEDLQGRQERYRREKWGEKIEMRLEGKGSVRGKKRQGHNNNWQKFHLPWDLILTSPSSLCVFSFYVLLLASSSPLSRSLLSISFFVCLISTQTFYVCACLLRVQEKIEGEGRYKKWSEERTARED